MGEGEKKTYVFMRARASTWPSAPAEGVEKYSYLSPDDESHPTPTQRRDERVGGEEDTPYEPSTVSLESERAPLEEEGHG